MLNAFQSEVNLRNWDLERRPTLVAVSGGVDSVVLARLFAMAGYMFDIIHVNFALRGAESEFDEVLVRNLAKDLGVKYFSKTVDTKSYIQQNGVSLQMAARDLRYDFFYQTMREGNYSYLATAHHADDNLEHFFIYAYRGNMAVAWRGILVENRSVIRPLLGFKKQLLVAFANENGWDWREDSTNSGTNYLRNKIRHWIMPAVQESVMEFVKISSIVERVQHKEHENESILWDLMCSIWRGGWHIPSVYYDDPKRRNYLCERLLTMGFSKTQVSQALGVEQVGKKFQSNQFTLWIGRGAFTIEPMNLEAPHTIAIEFVEGFYEWGQYRFKIRICDGSAGKQPLSKQQRQLGIDPGSMVVLDAATKETSKSAIDSTPQTPHQKPHAKGVSPQQCYYFSTALIGKVIVLRSWVGGDTMEIFGGKHKKLSDLLIDHKIEPFAKPWIPIVSSSKGILCVVGLRRSSLFPIQFGETEWIELSWEHI